MAILIAIVKDVATMAVFTLEARILDACIGLWLALPCPAATAVLWISLPPGTASSILCTSAGVEDMAPQAV
jgi:hypothetical protein